MPAYAHTLEGKSKEQWEPLFTPFGHAAERKDRIGQSLPDPADWRPPH